MHAVGDGPDRIVGEHAARYLAMLHGYAVDVVGTPQSQISHIENA